MQLHVAKNEGNAGVLIFFYIGGVWVRACGEKLSSLRFDFLNFIFRFFEQYPKVKVIDRVSN